MRAEAFVLACLIATNACAASDADLDAIRKEIADLKASYESRIQALERKLKDAEDRAASTPAPAPTPMPTTPSSASSVSAFNPAVSVVLQGTYANLSQDPGKFAIAGFPLGGDVGPGKRGFSLSESELALFANVDDKFAGNLIVALSPEDTASVEEAYGVYVPGVYGAVPKFGRFFSGIGYLNEQHQHVWDFVDAPLAYQAFLGGQFAQDGIQGKWIAPTEHYIEVGGDIGRGDRFPGSRKKNGVGSGAAYVHTGGDIGESHNWRAGVSYLHTSTDDPADPLHDARTAIADFVWKWAPNGNTRETNFKIQGEYFHRDAAIRQSGWYAQGVYQFMPAWRIAVRYDRLDAGAATSFNPERYTAMVDWSPSEFSRLRLQLARSKTVDEATDNQLFVQYILSLGAHGAHRY